MVISTLGQLMDWLLQAPRTRLETLRATLATPEDLAAAISLLTNSNHLRRSIESDGVLRAERRGRGMGARWVLQCPVAGCRQNYPFRDLHLAGPWVEVAVREAAREWRGKSDPSRNEAKAAVRGEGFLAMKLGRRPLDQEAALFWEVVDGAKGVPDRTTASPSRRRNGSRPAPSTARA